VSFFPAFAFAMSMQPCSAPHARVKSPDPRSASAS
jgi:hypothetical protein